ncbi:pyridoxamine 5'-phosphate oxidase family protein [Streptacidiphilus rugosus]|uniref:pyridoxamine 5'-phosphate oxidase family protein n=1 Tax=Streptacidiphilus rugosus TaxID=405783 RepID=UPI000566DA71|nr:pyridoxamine 5'-phosphate oxidase family protein [Streptacidiphilus rugosus]
MDDSDRQSTGQPRAMRPLDPAEAMGLLGSVGLGRVVFTRDALPAIRPVNHLVEDGDIIIRTHDGAALTTATGADQGGVVVAYEADQIDPDTHTGWSVIVTGYAHRVTDPAENERYRTLLRPWVDRATDCAVRIHPELITGFQLTGTPPFPTA